MRDVLERYRGRPLADFVITTNHVVAEIVTLLLKKAGPDPRFRHELAVRVGQQLLAEVFGQVHQATVEDERAALAYLARHQDKDYSFVDCLSFVALPGPLPR